MQCYICEEEIFLKAYEEEIDGVLRPVCGKCCDRVCYLCGKSKRKDGIMRFSYEKNPDTGEFVYIGSCCTFVAGKMDMFKIYSEKYNNMKKNDPAQLAHIMLKSEEARVKRAAALTDPREAEKLIDHWAGKQKRNKQKYGQTRKKQ